MKINKGEIGMGFYVGIGLLLAVLVWHFVSMLMARVAGGRNGG